MFNLPNTTEFNKEIPKEKLFIHTFNTSLLRELYDEQIEKVVGATNYRQALWKSQQTVDLASLRCLIFR